MIETCETCKYWVQEDVQSDKGQCRTLPPQVDIDEGKRGIWPITLATEGCGEHEDIF
jgi:hypothetical protein